MKKRLKRRQFLKYLFRFCLYGLIFGLLGLGIVFIYFAKDLPDPEKISQRELAESTKIYDRTGQVLLYDIHGEEKRTVIPFEQIPQAMKGATIVAEDDNFYHHIGLDFRAIIRAFLANLKGQKITQGGSTITQQFIKNSFLTPERTFSRKIKEAILALELEWKYPKDKILEFYLNQVPYGSNAYGVEAATQTFFDKSARDLTLAESALLAALPKAPTYYSPYGSNPEKLKARQEYILERMEKFGYITKEECEEAKTQPIKFSRAKASIKAPHFVMYVKQYLVEKYGEDYIQRAGLKIYTTLDWDLQQLAEQIVAEGVETNIKKIKAFNAALVAIDPKTGQVLAMVGSKDYFAEPLPEGCDPGKSCKFEPNVNVAIRERQPGSSFKPFVYAAAFQKGYTPETMLFDLKTEFATSERQKSYQPQNYDGRFRGPVTMRQALAQSLNVPSVKTLYLAGIDKSINLAHDMGVTTLQERQRYGLSLVLGGGEIKLLDEVAAFGVFATEGIKHPQKAILKIEDKDGRTLEKFEDNPRQVLEKNIACQINDILSDNETRAPMFGSHSPLVLEDRPAAVKTGTTQEYRDAWTVGYTPSLVAGVWVGNNDNTPIQKQGAGVYAAAPIWNQFMTKAYEIIGQPRTQLVVVRGQPQNEIEALGGPSGSNKFILPKEPEVFQKPTLVLAEKPVLNGSWANERIFKIDKISGKLATEFTPPELIEQGAYQEVHCLLYYVDKNNPQGIQPEKPAQDPQFWNWEEPVLEWAKNPPCSEGGVCPLYNQLAPQDYDDIHIPANQPKLEITSPQDKRVVFQPLLTITASSSAPLGVKQLDFFFNDKFIGSDNQVPFGLSYLIPETTLNGRATIRVRAFDTVLNRSEKEIKIYLAIPGHPDYPEEED